MDVGRFVERYVTRVLGVILYFAGFPILTSVVFSLAAGELTQAFLLLFAAFAFFAASTLLLESVFGRDAVLILLISSGWPLALFLLFNVSITAAFAHSAYAAIKQEASQLIMSDLFARVFQGYERIVPKLWVTALLYGSATIGFGIARRAQRRFRPDP